MTSWAEEEKRAKKAAWDEEVAKRRKALGPKGRIIEDIQDEVRELRVLCQQQHDELMRMCSVIESVRQLLHAQENRIAMMRSDLSVQRSREWVNHGR